MVGCVQHWLVVLFCFDGAHSPISMHVTLVPGGKRIADSVVGHSLSSFASKNKTRGRA